MKIAILDDYQNVVKDLDCFKKLEQHDVTVFTETYSEQDLVAKLVSFEAIVLIRERTEITESLLSQLPNLKLISQTGKVSNHIDPQMCERFGVTVLEGRGSPVAPSELCWALIMAASRHIPTYASNLKQNQWQDSGSLGLGRTLKGLKLGIWGYGKIGKCIALYAQAFGMSVVVWGSQASRDQAQADGFEAATTKQNFFREVDVLSLHLRLNGFTRGCVTAHDLSLMKPDSLFVNISRAELVEPMALYHELCGVPTKTAAIDVFDCEPATEKTEPLLSLPNVTATPHLGYVEQNSYELYFDIAFDNILSYQMDGHVELCPMQEAR
ncbi:D-2-hydroxyacid dehydrogenase family protein [Vibrio crassostreae]|uniref:D-2-hydroxyacid dehydrogenase family protein n=1 Tax=Vibrio crassostreae TaxID=246167 RepID=UPI000F471EFC|nr:D-2-hydroxyacid dehydrogenase family protein [Vibrio crassostreae]NOH75526.1 D-2-hydroxyacid dehydrogenase family protein [Vibrio crassostreae]NOI53248.1 D-2-hydroxyacid dehydrogenase family protein [Vibrio crassostreae]ROR15931.1 D-3-phosphoglycerate dehydrogenase [Vibrio crassostreae]CAK2068111.1 D-2-hydroxyacid dehydrogenase family protein [Vibrio crassostreae]CAK2342528.1 D-2-hydroxyacid dehydrogenase family protein [Vibrio crassostreae]